MTDDQDTDEAPVRDQAAPPVRSGRRDLAAVKAALALIREANSRANAPRRGRWRRRRG